ncbi:FAD-dependent oxidoreductase [Jannaschia sp. M317]|uniref:FAD-dependent oxidoreductase n=1 Tax=Jannaschia sp. M317 TaxID=2867011 RepID=UPI0021A90DD7|nr:FAD-dependent oxidoreductase [Jannaschia sp. M317]UWQ19885.1 FAD-dependent oxidoreductase [Jannaschia sp. M317]
MAHNVAIIGSGPAGFFTAEALLRSEADVRVDMFERLPVPFGLVRYGVAPDHQKLKSVTALFETLADHKDFTFLGNVSVGTDVSIEEMRASYDAVVVATGALRGRDLGIPGEELDGNLTATDFIGWYNGHPDFRDVKIDLSHRRAIVIGNGNVALDVCRILSKTVDELRGSDISAHALDALAESQVRDVHLVGRRGPAQAKFTAKELREFGTLAQAEPILHPDAIRLAPACAEEAAETGTPGVAKNLKILKGFADRKADPAKSRRIYFHFNMAPDRITGTDHAEEVVFKRMRLEGPAFGQRAVPTGAETSLRGGMVIGCVGYRGFGLPGLPFDAARGTIPNVSGQVHDTDGTPLPGVYTAGWIKRGPSGVIGTNRACGVETADQVLAGLTTGRDTDAARDAFVAALAARLDRVVDFAAWRRIDAREKADGARRGKPREKVTDIATMLAEALPDAEPKLRCAP